MQTPIRPIPRGNLLHERAHHLALVVDVAGLAADFINVPRSRMFMPSAPVIKAWEAPEDVSDDPTT